MAFPLFSQVNGKGASRDVAASAPAQPNGNTRMLGGSASHAALRSLAGKGSIEFARGREVAALVLWTFAVFIVLGLASYEGDPAGGPGTGANWVGPVGEACARAVVTLVGVIGWAIPLEAALLGIPFVRGKRSLATPARLAGDLLIVIIAASLVQVGGPGKLAFGKHIAGGAVGELFGELARSLFSTIGSFLVGFALLGLILIARASFSFIALLTLVGAGLRRGFVALRAAILDVIAAWREARALEREAAEARRIESLPHIKDPREASAEATIAIIPEAFDDDELVPEDPDVSEPEDPEAEPEVAAKPARKRAPRVKKEAPVQTSPEPVVVAEEPVASEPAPKKRGRRKKKEELELEEEVEAAISEPTEEAEEEEEPPPPPKRSSPPKAAPVKTDVKLEPTIVDTSAALAKEEAPAPAKEKVKLVPAANAGFRTPPIDFLVPAKADPKLAVDEETLFKDAELLVKTLADYGVSGKVEDILPGPTVTTFEVSPAAGTKVSKVASLADDLALALARKVRIVAPIPGKNRIGFELPNEKRIPVNLRDLVDDARFQSMDAPLPVVLGRDIVGAPVYADLASMPHVIVAGATGAGKSVGLNVMLTSLLYRRTPEELRLLMIDPKVVELAPFDRIPHMLLPVVTDMKQASTALKWAVDEMERRYQLFADAGTKNIGTYNNWVERVRRGEARNPLPKTIIGKDHNNLPDEIVAGEGDEGVQQFPDKMPFIVIVVDEFADLMMQQGKEVEAAVARLAQKARAAGMHVILATQRPSVDVITGMIKANFPTRIAFRVAQKVDSRTILDEQGADHLLGRGDMLVKLNGTNETKRVQCPWVSEEEVQTVTDFLRLQGEPVYDENILKPRDDDGEGQHEEDAEQDALYDDAVRCVAETRRCSTSWLQRKLGLGYNRAARIVEMMERRGLVGPSNGAKDREVLITPL